MSLLLDALKRAEQEKLTRQASPTGETAPARPSPAAAAVLELQPLGGAMAPGSGPRAEGASAQAAHAAQAVFKAKAVPAPPRGRRMLWFAGGVVLIVVVAAGAYVWHTLKALSPRPAAIAIRAPFPAVPPAAAPAPAAKPAAPPEAPGASTASATNAAAVAPAAPAPSLGETVKPARETSRGPDLQALLGAPRPPAAPPVELSRREEPPPRVSPGVQAGYRALLAGDLATAREQYAKSLAAEPANMDAELGLATVEARSGNAAAAAALYRRALDLDPRNPTALAGLASLADLSRPEATENALRGEIARHPESAALELTLGNLLAAQGRWVEAQAAFFEAQRLQPENADVAYNLAVSLDHLGQRRAAADFYRRALQARAHGAAQFDAAAASRRLAEIAR